MAHLTTRRFASSIERTLNLNGASRKFLFSYTHRTSTRTTQSSTFRQFSYTPLRNADAATSTTPSMPQPISTTPKPPFRKPASRFTKPHEPAPPTARHEKVTPSAEQPISEYTSGFADAPPDAAPGNEEAIDWTRSFSGLSQQPFSKEAGEILMQPLNKDDIEVKPDGIVFLPEIKYRRILNRAFGPGGWGMAPRGETIVTSKSVTREYALLAHGRLVSIARGEQDYFDPEGIPTATEGCKSNALMRCCKDLGVASELWDPRYIRRFLAENSKEVWVEHTVTAKRRKIHMRKDDEVKGPYKLATNSRLSSTTA